VKYKEEFERFMKELRLWYRHEDDIVNEAKLDEIIEGLEAFIAGIELKEEWTEIKKEMPRIGDWVTAYSKGMVLHLFLDGLGGARGENAIWLSMDGDWNHKVTHWQPLPPVPAHKDLGVNGKRILE